MEKPFSIPRKRFFGAMRSQRGARGLLNGALRLLNGVVRSRNGVLRSPRGAKNGQNCMKRMRLLLKVAALHKNYEKMTCAKQKATAFHLKAKRTETSSALLI
jgi:hypothetical protein